MYAWIWRKLPFGLWGKLAGSIGLTFPVPLGICHQDADPPHPLGLLRARGERQGERAAQKGDELAPLHTPP